MTMESVLIHCFFSCVFFFRCAFFSLSPAFLSVFRKSVSCTAHLPILSYFSWALVSFSPPFLCLSSSLLLQFEYLMSALPLVTMHYFSALLRAHWLFSLPLTLPGLRPETDTISDRAVSHPSSCFNMCDILAVYEIGMSWFSKSTNSIWPLIARPQFNSVCSTSW